MTTDTNTAATPETGATTDKGERGGVQISILQGIVQNLLAGLREGAGDRDKRRQVEDWMRSLAEKYPEFSIEKGLKEYYLAEAMRLRSDFDAATDLSEKLSIGRTIETFLEKAGEFRS